MRGLITLLVILPGLVHAQIFRCESRGDTYYSQIPCADSSELVIIEDRPMFSESPPTAEAIPQIPPPSTAPERTPAQRLREFISTLRNQRSEQVGQIDHDIAELESRLKAEDESPSDTGQREAISGQLKELRASHSAIVAQYESLIAEAERQVSELMANESTAGSGIQ